MQEIIAHILAESKSGILFPITLETFGCRIHDLILLYPCPWMLAMEFVAEIKRRHFVSGESINSIALSLKLFRPAVRKA